MRGRGFGKRLGIVLAAVVAWGAGALGAQETSRVEELAREVEALKSAVRELQQRQPTADVTELERRIELLAAELETLQLGEAAPRAVAAEAEAGFGPAASKVYRVTEGLSIGGYGEMVYQGFDSTRDDGAPSNRNDELDFLRAIVYVGYKWNDRWLFNSEIEWEHARAGEGQRGEVSVEFAYLERRIRPEINARGGLLLLPVGLINELHEPTTFHAARRPGIEGQILPTTWRENGAGIFGEIGPVTYRTYLVNGLEARRFGAAGLRGGRQNGARAVAEDFAWVGRVDWTGTPGLLAGVSVYAGDSGQDLEDAAGPIAVGTRILDAHLQWRWRGLDLRALWVEADLDEVARLNRALGLAGAGSVGEALEGCYLEAGYDLLSLLAGAKQSLTPFARFERYDTQAEVPAGFARNPANDVEILTLGLAWRPLEQVILKADYQDVDNAAGSGVDQVNLALGYVF
jgi:hypothetical protein